MPNSKKSSSGNNSAGKTKSTRRTKTTASTRKQTPAARPKKTAAAKRKPILPTKADKLVSGLVAQPEIILDQTPPQIVGPSLPFDIEHPRLQGIDPGVLQQCHEDNLVVHQYPDRNTIEVDENGYVVGYVTAPEGKSYSIRPADEHIVVPEAVLHGLMQQQLPAVLKSKPVLNLLTGLESTDEDGSYKVPSNLLHGLLDLNLPDPLGAKGKGGKGGKGGGHPVPSPQLAEQVYKQLLGGVPQVGYKDNLVVGIQNGEFLNASKANFYLEVWKMIAVTSHISMWIEVDGPALDVVGKAIGYGHFCCKPNSRGQGVGFLLHPRLRLLAAPETIWAIANVGNTPDLRPGYRLYVEDTVSGWKGYVEVLHPKSMRGGPAQTAPTRFKQFEEAVKANQGLTQILLGGDLNCFLNNTTDTLPLTQAGYVLIYPHDTTSTQAMGGRLDGLFVYQVAQKVGHYQVFNGWKNKQIGRGVTDHGYLRFVIYNTGGTATEDGDNGQVIEVVV